MIVTLPLILVIMQQQQEIRGNAQKSTTLYFTPPSSSASPIIKKVGESFYLDVMVNPGVNLVSLVKVEITYDPTRIKPSAINPFVVNQSIFPEIVEGPVYSSGKIQAILSVGPDLSNAVGLTNRVATLNFDSLSATTLSLVSFGTNTKILSVAATDPGSENVLSTTSPAYLKIIKTKGSSGSGGKGRK